VVDKGNKRPRGRPRGFALDAAIQAGQHLFHEHGYENVSVATLTEAIGITPPSFYAAFGSKGAFFEDTLRLYSATVVPLDRFLVPGRSPRTALADMLTATARAYAAHPQRRGCLILEHARTGATEWGIAATRIAGTNRDRLRAFLEASDVPAPGRATDYVAATMLGLSAAAREGWDETRLSAVAEAAAAGLDQLLLRGPSPPAASS
jgi:TetR/AcrR family transcriptional repressor for divergent bdcA